LRTTIYTTLLALAAAGAVPAGTIALSGSTDLVAFNGTDTTITLGELSCSSPGVGTCTYTGSQSIGSGTLTWQFQTPNTAANITWDYLGDLFGPTGGTFSASDGSDSLNGSYVLNSWAPDGILIGDYEGIDLDGTITVTGVTLNGGSDPNEGAFESLLSVPATSSYSFVLDVGDCSARGRGETFCIVPTDPTAQFESLTLTAQGTAAPEPGTLGLMTVGLLAAFGVRRRMNGKSPRLR